MSAALHMIARIGGHAVALPAAEVESVVDLGPITPIPRAGDGVIGLAALRSRVATVVEPRVTLQLPPDETPGARAVVAKIDGHLYALLVDAVEDVADHAVAPLPPGFVLTGAWAGLGERVVDRAGSPVLVVSPARLIPRPAAAA